MSDVHAVMELENVRVRYRAIDALKGVSCRLDRGAIGLLGPNGAGKSTLLKSALGFVRPSEGRVSLFGLDMPRDRLAIRRRLGYMPEKDVVSPKISAVSFLTYCGRLSGMSRADAMERAHETLGYVGLDDARYRKMETYSTGMRQRVKFAQALIHDPKLLLLDEPTNGLDPEGRTEMLELIRRLAYGRGVTVLLSSHLLPDVKRVCDRVLIIVQGRIVRDAAMAELTAFKAGMYEVRVDDARQAFLDRLAAADYSCIGLQNGRLRVSAPPHAQDADRARRFLFQTARSCGTHIRHFQAVRNSLEDAFMQAVEGVEASNPALLA